MQISVNSQVFATELRLLKQIVPSKPAIAILSHALLEAGDGVSLYATDLEVGLRATFQASVTVPGSVTLPVARLLAMVEQFPDADVNLTVSKSSVTVKCGAFTARLQAMPVADFPAVPDVDGVALGAVALRQLIARTRYAVNPTSSQSVLRGALLTLAGSIAAMVATDGRRLALATTGRAEGVDRKVLIPMKALDMLAGHDGEVELTVDDRHLYFASGDRLLVSRTIDGTFPASERIIPRDNDKLITVDRLALAAALRRVQLAAEETQAIFFDVKDGNVVLTAASAGIGSADEAVPVGYAGPALKFCTNGSFVLDFLNAAGGQSVTLALKDAKSAMLMTDGADHVGVVMLMRS